MQGHCAEENVDMLSLLLTFPFLMCLQCRSQRCGPIFDELICQGHVPKDNNYDLRRLAACIKPVITCNSSNSCCTQHPNHHNIQHTTAISYSNNGIRRNSLSSNFYSSINQSIWYKLLVSVWIISKCAKRWQMYWKHLVYCGVMTLGKHIKIKTQLNTTHECQLFYWVLQKSPPCQSSKGAAQEQQFDLFTTRGSPSIAPLVVL